ncbi:hypothetical protein [Streptomyces rubiginosohelvolus]
MDVLPDPAGASEGYDWPPGAKCFGPATRDEWVGIPAATEE